MAEFKEAPSRLPDPVSDQWADNRSLAYGDRNGQSPVSQAEAERRRRATRTVRQLSWLWVAAVTVGFLIKSISINWSFGTKDSSFGLAFSTGWIAWVWIAAAIIPPIVFRLRARRAR
ncbi:MAG: hypothetical protein ABI647_13935 [Gemmatimonadota bacterium]